MKFNILVELRTLDENVPLVKISGASEETRNLILNNYSGANYCITSEPEEETLTGPEAIETLDLTIRSYNCLKRAGIRTVIDLIKVYNKGELPYVRNLGNKSFHEIEDKLILLSLVPVIRLDKEVNSYAWTGHKKD
jgi:DNA-directed RNA polymerase alpha subunit